MTYIEKAIPFIDAWLGWQIRLQTIPGHSVSIVHQGRQVYRRAFGYSNIETKQPLTSDHGFRVASHSKTFTATAIMMLVESGDLDTDDKISKYLPELKEAQDKRLSNVTLRHLLSHTSGMVRDGIDTNFWYLNRPFLSVKEVLDAVSGDQVIYGKAGKFKYSNIGFEILGLVIERVSGLTYEAFLQKNIFDPLNLKNIGGNLEASDTILLSDGHMTTSPDAGYLSISSKYTTNEMRGSTSVYATPTALCAFYTALITGKIVDHETLQVFLEPISQVDENRGYGLGFETHALSGYQVYGHGGSMPGHGSRTYFNIEDQIVISIAGNAQNTKTLPLHEGIWHILAAFKKDKTAFLNPKFPQYRGDAYGLWQAFYYVPKGGNILECNLCDPKPLASCAVLKNIDDGRFLRVKDQGFGSLGEETILESENNRLLYAETMGASAVCPELHKGYVQRIQESFSP